MNITATQGLGPPAALTINIVAAGSEPPPPSPLTLGAATEDIVDLTTVTDATVSVRKPDGSLVAWVAEFSATPSLDVTGATANTPVVVSVANTEALVLNSSVTVNAIGGITGAAGELFAQVLSPTTAALFFDAEFQTPTVGGGAYTSGGTVTPNALATVVYDFAASSPSSPVGDLDQVGVYSLAVQLSVPGGVVPCRACFLNVVSAFSGGRA